MVNKAKKNNIIGAWAFIELLSIIACYPIFDIKVFQYSLYHESVVSMYFTDVLMWILPFAFLSFFVHVVVFLLIVATLGRDRCMNAIAKYFTTD